jgi:hypothetical protein
MSFLVKINKKHFLTHVKHYDAEMGLFSCLEMTNHITIVNGI